MRRKQKKALIRIIVAAVLMVVLGLVSHFTNINEYVLFALYMVASCARCRRRGRPSKGRPRTNWSF